MTIVGLHDFVKVSISASFKSFLLIICIDAPESTTNSRSSGLRFDCAGRHLFSDGEKNVALFFSFNLNTLLASFHAASRAPCSCHSVSSWDRSSNFGALGLRWWGSPGQIYPNEGFWSRMSAWRATAFVNFTRWIGFCMSELFRKIDENFGGNPERRNPIVVYLMSCTQRVRDSTHDKCHALQRVAPFYHDFCHGSQRVATFDHAAHTFSTWLLLFCHHSF